MTSHYYDLQIKRYSLTTLSELAHYLEEIGTKRGGIIVMIQVAYALFLALTQVTIYI